MNVLTARGLAHMLLAAADAAIAAGNDEVDLGSTLAQADDAARAELQAAITAAGG